MTRLNLFWELLREMLRRMHPDSIAVWLNGLVMDAHRPVDLAGDGREAVCWACSNRRRFVSWPCEHYARADEARERLVR